MFQSSTPRAELKGKMAARILGFQFTDKSFFNAEASTLEIESLKGEFGEWNAQKLAEKKARQYGVKLPPSTYLQQVQIGGFKEATSIGALHQFVAEEEAECPQTCPQTQRVEEDNPDDLAGRDVGTFVWTHERVLLLIETYREHLPLFGNSAIKRHEIWRKIAIALNAKRHTVTGDICDKKFSSLKNRYKLICDGNQASGRGRRRWEYFDVMDELLAGDPAVRPNTTVSTITGQEDRPNAEETSAQQQEASAPPADHPSTSAEELTTSSLGTSKGRNWNQQREETFQEKEKDPKSSQSGFGNMQLHRIGALTMDTLYKEREK